LRFILLLTAHCFDAAEREKHMPTVYERKAKAAREWFAENGPLDAPLLPLSDGEIEDARHARGLIGMVGFYARSLAYRQWNIREHPAFFDFACGLMASDTGSWRIEKDEHLKMRFPPRPLAGMTPGARWLPPKEYEEIMTSRRRARSAA
jgi:hypothetical protein